MATDASCSLTAEAEITETEIQDPAQPSTRFLARQPILNVRRQVVGYELLFRTNWENCFHGERGEATRQTLDNYLYMGIESLANNGFAFVNCTREALVNRWVTLLPPQATVLEILETVEPDLELIEACKELRALGYRIALDDFVPRPEMQPLVEIADYVKVDIRLCDAPARKQIIRMARAANAALVAEKVEDQDDFNTVRAEGFEFFQGYFFCRPKIMANREIPPSRMNYFQLLRELAKQPLNLRRVAALVKLETSLCYRLLLLANSARWNRRTGVTSVEDAFMLVGEDRFRALVSVAASCVMSQQQPPALITMSLERARFCELLAPMVGEDPNEQFMLGMMSLLDAILEAPMGAIAKSLPLREEVRAALLGASNPTSVPLCIIRGFESGAWGCCADMIQGANVSEESLAHLYFEAIRWAADVAAASS